MTGLDFVLPTGNKGIPKLAFLGAKGLDGRDRTIFVKAYQSIGHELLYLELLSSVIVPRNTLPDYILGISAQHVLIVNKEVKIFLGSSQ